MNQDQQNSIPGEINLVDLFKTIFQHKYSALLIFILSCLFLFWLFVIHVNKSYKLIISSAHYNTMKQITSTTILDDNRFISLFNNIVAPQFSQRHPRAEATITIKKITISTANELDRKTYEAPGMFELSVSGKKLNLAQATSFLNKAITFVRSNENIYIERWKKIQQRNLTLIKEDENQLNTKSKLLEKQINLIKRNSDFLHAWLKGSTLHDKRLLISSDKANNALWGATFSEAQTIISHNINLIAILMQKENDLNTLNTKQISLGNKKRELEYKIQSIKNTASLSLITRMKLKPSIQIRITAMIFIAFFITFIGMLLFHIIKIQIREDKTKEKLQT